MFATSTQEQALPCIRCGDCISVCPEKLHPQLLMLAANANDESAANALSLNQCNECAACDFACPSRIPLSVLFKTAKQTFSAIEKQRQQRSAARQRFENRTVRLQRLAEEKEKRHDQRKQNVASSDAVAQALARAKAKREQAKGGEA